MMITIRTAGERDRAAAEELLRSAELPTAGLADDDATHLWVALHEGEVVGSAAIEVHGRDAVLRSVCVASRGRGTGVGASLVTRCISEGRERGLRNLYLLTETAAGWFPRFGFVPIERDAVPEAIAASIGFASLCPASAVAMALSLSPPPSMESPE